MKGWMNNVQWKQPHKKAWIAVWEANGGAVGLQDIFDYVDIALNELRQEINNPHNVKVDIAIDEAAKAAAEKAVADILNCLK